MGKKASNVCICKYMCVTKKKMSEWNTGRQAGGDFPGGPVVKTLPPNAGAQVPSLVRELRSHTPRGQKTKT